MSTSALCFNLLSNTCNWGASSIWWFLLNSDKTLDWLHHIRILCQCSVTVMGTIASKYDLFLSPSWLMKQLTTEQPCAQQRYLLQWSPLHPNLCYTGVSRIWSAVVSSCWLRWSPSAQSAAPLRSSHLDFQDIRIICRFFKISGPPPPTSGAPPPPSRASHPSVPSLFAPTARTPATPWISPHSTPPASSYPPPRMASTRDPASCYRLPPIW